MLGKVIGTLILGSGLGIPISATLRKTIVSERIPRILETSDSIVKFEWKEKGADKEIGKLIDGLWEIIKEGSETNKPKVLAVRISTEGAFDEEVCTKLGFDPGLKEPPKDPRQKADPNDSRGIGCYTNLHI